MKLKSQSERLARLLQEAINKEPCEVCEGFAWNQKAEEKVLPCSSCYGTGLSRQCVARMLGLSPIPSAAELEAVLLGMVVPWNPA